MGRLSPKLPQRPVIRLVALASAFGLLACDNARAPTAEGAQPAASKPAQPARKKAARKKANMKTANFDWSVTPKGSTLAIDYRGTNSFSERIYIADRLVVKDGPDHFATTDKVIVIRFEEPGKDPDVVEVILGEEASNRDFARGMERPTYRPVEPGADFGGSVSIPFPVKSWHPLGGTEPIPASVTGLRFRLQYFKGEPPGWGTRPSKSGAIKIPGGNPRRAFFEGAARPIPK